MDISELKTGVKKQQPEQKPATGKNIDGKELRDFGNGLKEFDPTANGFEPEVIERKADDATRALQTFDQQLEKRKEEVERYNELLDEYGGQISEEQLREELGQSHITEQLHDGKGGKFDEKDFDASEILGENENREETATYSQDIDNTPVSTSTPVQSKELDDLERELEEDNEEQVYYGTSMVEESPKKEEPKITEFPKKQSKPTVQEKVEPVEEKKTDLDNMSEEDKDLAALEDEYEAPTEDFDEKLKAELSKKLKPVSKKFDLSHAVVVDKPVTVTNALNTKDRFNKRIFTWSLLRSKRPITMKAFTATELNALNTYVRNDTRSRETFTAIWDHIIGVGKGKDFDSWAKCTSYYDVDNIWFCVYGACFNEANYLPFSCRACDGVTISTDIPVEQMCKYDNPEVKAEMERIRKLPEDPKMGNVFAEYRVQISDTIVAGFREPSIYDAVIAPNMFDTEFKNKYNDIIGICAYISNIYVLEETPQGIALRPIAVKTFINNELKTAKARIIQYAKIIRSLNSDQYNIIMGHINAITVEPAVTYGLPSISCDHCGKEIPEERNAAADLVFMRHRLAILGV